MKSMCGLKVIKRKETKDIIMILVVKEHTLLKNNMGFGGMNMF